MILNNYYDTNNNYQTIKTETVFKTAECKVK